MIEGNWEQRLAAVHSTIEKVARAGDLPTVVTSVLGDLVRFVDALANDTQDDLYRLGSEVGMLRANVQRLQVEVDSLKKAADAAGTISASLQVDIRRLDQVDQKPG